MRGAVIAVAAAALLAAVPGRSAAQAPRDSTSSWLAPGSRVRLTITVPGAPLSVEGRLVGVGGEEIVLTTRKGHTQREPLRGVATAELYERRPAWRGALLWGTVGALVGAGWSVATGGAYHTAGDVASSHASVFAVFGALLGATAGRGHWVEVPLPATR